MLFKGNVESVNRAIRRRRCMEIKFESLGFVNESNTCVFLWIMRVSGNGFGNPEKSNRWDKIL
jgi:hypothetical protein